MFELHHSDCIAFMRTLPDNHVDAIVTDPPYELGFMGKSWDRSGIANSVEMWTEALRILKPGGHLLAFSGSRTYHRMTCAIEDAGFEVRDQIMWLYGSGFPKSHDVSKAIDREVGAEREVVGRLEYASRRPNPMNGTAYNYNVQGYDISANLNITAPATDAAKQWHGWGTALKPAHEPICVARKPLIGTVAENVLTWGTGGVNVDGCRVGTGKQTPGGKQNSEAPSWLKKHGYGSGYGPRNPRQSGMNPNVGRWPANVIHDGSDEVVAGFPETAAAKASNRGLQHTGRHGGLADIGGNIKVGTDTVRGHDDAGGSAARFFYCAKASKRDRDEGCEGMEKRKGGAMSGVETREGKPTNHLVRTNHHPTVKPTDLMRYLCRLVTPPNGLVFDPFTGSGSTGKAAILEGFRFIGCDMTAEYIDIARARIEHAMKQTAPVPIVPPDEDPAQMTLF